MFSAIFLSMFPLTRLLPPSTWKPEAQMKLNEKIYLYAELCMVILSEYWCII